MYSMKTLVLCLLVCVTVCGTIRKPKPVVILKCCKNNEYLPLSGDNKCVQNDSSSWHIDIFNGRKGHFEMHTSLPEHWIIKEGMIPKCAKPKKLFFKSRSSIPFLNGSIYSVEYGKLLHPDQICIDYNAFLVCLNEPHNLIKKCCGENAIFSETNGTCRNFNDQSYKIDVGQNWTLGAGFPICTENKLHVVVGELHKSKIFDNGSLLVDNKIILSAGNFCLEHVLEHTGRSASVITCPEHLPPQPQPSRPQNETDLRFTIYPIGLAISVIFLAATLAAGALMPASHHVLHWRCQTNHVTCLLLGDVLLCVTHLSGRIDFWPCFMIGYQRIAARIAGNGKANELVRRGPGNGGVKLIVVPGHKGIAAQIAGNGKADEFVRR
ncbi:unnamed protein product [Phaedon cochleariae]|uniref:Uncharacterized protein n=1 Tax=Phaedon cochleariae TaxID=80249 RepID=A0A9N9SGF0_PHACE|nr:unnamed protein product [Phaedon cochleariae]